MDNVTGAVRGAVDSVKETCPRTVECVKQTFDLPSPGGPSSLTHDGRAPSSSASWPASWLDVPKRRGRWVERPAIGPAVGRFAQSAARISVPTASTVGSTAARLARGVFGRGLVRLAGIDVRPRDRPGERVGDRYVIRRDPGHGGEGRTGAISPQVREIIDSITTKMGGKPVEGPILEATHSSDGEEEEVSSRRY